MDHDGCTYQIHLAGNLFSLETANGSTNQEVQYLMSNSRTGAEAIWNITATTANPNVSSCSTDRFEFTYGEVRIGPKKVALRNLSSDSGTFTIWEELTVPKLQYSGTKQVYFEVDVKDMEENLAMTGKFSKSYDTHTSNPQQGQITEASEPPALEIREELFNIPNFTDSIVTINPSLTATTTQITGITVEDASSVTSSLSVGMDWLINFAGQLGESQGQSITNLSTHQISRTFQTPAGITIPAHSRLIGTYSQYSKDFLGDINYWDSDLVSGLYLDGQIRFTLHGYSGIIEYTTVPIP